MVQDVAYLLTWLGLWGFIAFVAMGYDKLQANRHGSRMRERSLSMLALLGGFIGILIGAFAFHHKTRKLRFWPPVAVAALLWGLAILLMFRTSLLA